MFHERCLVRPTSQGSKDNNNRKDKSEIATSPTINDTTTPSTPEFPFNESVLQSVGKPLKEVIEKVIKVLVKLFYFTDLTC